MLSAEVRLALAQMISQEGHWHPLLRARAIENQCYVLAPAQIGPHAPTAHRYGHSLVVDRWGTAIAESSNQEGVNVASLDLQVAREVRVQLPSLANRRLACQHAQLTSGRNCLRRCRNLAIAGELAEHDIGRRPRPYAGHPNYVRMSDAAGIRT